MTTTHDLIVIGASAGGVEALITLMAVASALPADLPAAVCVVLHIPPTSVSVLPRLLARSGPLPAAHPRNGAPLERGHIYVAPPDHHLLVRDGHVDIVRGPRENRSRPALDPLFRSAALAYGRRVVGVVLTGTLDDGTAGLLAIKRRGGLAVVQDPADALFPGMPSSALEYVAVDYCLPLTSIGPELTRLARTPASAADKGDTPMSNARDLEREVRLTELDRQVLDNDRRPGKPSPFGCPECGGVLWEMEDGKLTRYRCRVGHAYSPEALLATQSDVYEDALWSAPRALEEKAQLSHRLAERAAAQSLEVAAERFRGQETESERHVEALRELLLGGPHADAADLQPAAVNDERQPA